MAKVVGSSTNRNNDTSNSSLTFMNEVTSYFVEQGIGKKRVSILCKNLQKYGGKVSSNFNSEITHIIVNKSMKIEKLLKFLEVEKIDSAINIVNADWLSACFMDCRKCETTSYSICKNDAEPAQQNKDIQQCTVKETPAPKIIIEETKAQGTVEQISPTKISPWANERRKRRHSGSSNENSDSSYVDSGDDVYQKVSPMKEHSAESINQLKGSWICTKPSPSKGENLNEHITEKLEVLARAYENTQDRWRALSYKKVISAIKNHPKRIETAEEVKQLSCVGDRLAKKIIEIIETGHLRRLDHMGSNIDVINLFADVWGAGPKTAEAWVAQGFRTLEDLRQKADLNFQQKIGLKFYDEFLERMQRSEVEEIEKMVKETACELIPGMEVVTCGSYRRGKQTCGDIDILISHPDGRSHKGFLAKILDSLQQKGLITDDLITVDNEEQRKYMGVFKLPGENRKHRRIDIIVAPYSEWSCALVHFTGSGRLNRSMRQLAKTKGMSLSEHALREGVIRKGQDKLHKGTVVLTFSEEDIFRHLGLDYLEPQERDW